MSNGPPRRHHLYILFEWIMTLSINIILVMIYIYIILHIKKQKRRQFDYNNVRHMGYMGNDTTFFCFFFREKTVKMFNKAALDKVLRSFIHHNNQPLNIFCVVKLKRYVYLLFVCHCFPLLELQKCAMLIDFVRVIWLKQSVRSTSISA